MENLIDLSDPQSNYPMPQASNKVFGVIKRECFATEVTSMDENSGETLKPGIMIQIIPDYRGNGCHFKIRDFTNWRDKYKTTIYKCSKEDYIVVTMELWPYLLALKNDVGRIKFVEKVYSREFEWDMLKLGRVIRIRRPPNTSVEYYEFIVTHNGVVKENGTGYYIGLQLKNDHVSLSPDLKCLSRYYRFGGTGIVVPADWIMLNLYEEKERKPQPSVMPQRKDSSDWEKFYEEKCQPRLSNTSQYENSPSVDIPIDTAFEVTENNRQRLSTQIEEPKKIIKTGAIPKTHRVRHSSQILCDVTNSNPMNFSADVELNANADENVGNFEKGARRPSTSIVQPKKISDNAYDVTKSSDYVAEIELMNNAVGSVKNAEEGKCDLCAKTVEIRCGVILRECLHMFCKKCIRGHVESNSKYSGIRCPFSKDYECQFDLLDIEIKDLGGDSVYNEILNNRLKEFFGNNANAKICPNENCRHLWTVPKELQINNERCPKCKTNWCNICNNSHEPSEGHGNKSDKTQFQKVGQWIGNKFFGTQPAKATVVCAKCRKPTIPISECVKLQNCSHTICKNCIVPMVKTQTSGSQYAQCTICSKNLTDNEVTDICGLEVLKLFLDNRKKEPKAVTLQEMCNCSPSNPNCFFLLKCDHKMCRTILRRIVELQFKSKSRAACPLCLDEIDNDQINRLIGEKITDVVKCRTCNNQKDICLTICQHPYCHKCVQDTIIKQVSDPSKMSVNCNICDNPISNSDISRYGSEEMFALFKSKNEAAKAIPKSVDHIKLNDKPFQCVTCEKDISTNGGVILAGCQHALCLVCCKEFIGQQLSHSQSPACPICRKLLQQFEMEAIIGKSADVCGSTILIECLKCEEKFEEQLIRKCSNCLNPICLKCAKSTILAQITIKREPNCLFCQILLDKSQIASITTFNDQPATESRNESNISQRVEISFECLVCDQSANRDSQIVLASCKHEICRKCLNEKILDQIKRTTEPKCPICSKPIDQSQLNALGILTTSNTGPESSQSRKSISKISENVNMCSICFGPFRQSIGLKECGHEFCQVCISTSVSMQQSNSTTPKCPMCREPIDPIQITLRTALPVTDDKVNLLPNNRESSIPLRLNEQLFECPICEKQIDPECGVILANCDDPLCRDCISDVILQQAANSLTPQCPLCQTRITDEEIRALDPGVHEIFVDNRHDEASHDVENMYVCVICEETFQPHATKSLIICKDRFCRPCITAAFNDQFLVGRVPSCPLCMLEVDYSDIFDLCGMEGFKRYMDNKQNK